MTESRKSEIKRWLWMLEAYEGYTTDSGLRATIPCLRDCLAEIERLEKICQKTNTE